MDKRLSADLDFDNENRGSRVSEQATALISGAGLVGTVAVAGVPCDRKPKCEAQQGCSLWSKGVALLAAAFRAKDDATVGAVAVV